MKRLPGCRLWTRGLLMLVWALAGCVVPVEQAVCDESHPCPAGQICDVTIQLCYRVEDPHDGGGIPVDGGADPGPPILVTQTLQAARRNEQYRQKVLVDGGVPPLSYQLSSKAVELSWLSMDPSTGVLSGTASSNRGDYAVTVQVRETLGAQRSASRDFTLHVVDCNNGEKVACTASTATACILGTKTCQGGSFGPCENLAPSGEVSYCDSSCGSCGPSALACVNGACACGANLACSGATPTCCPSGASAACTNLQTDVNSCGSCGNACVPEHRANTVPTCAGGACQFPCETHYADCNHDLEADGCEVNLQRDAKACGSCDTQCPAPTGGSAVCNNGNCGQACPSNLTLCHNTSTNACLDVKTDKNNCGTCGNVCPSSAPNASGVTCTRGACTATCNASKGDCDNNLSNGCEADLMKDDNNCGACGNACNTAAGLGCWLGQCVPCGPCGITKKCCTVCDDTTVPVKCGAF